MIQPKFLFFALKVSCNFFIELIVHQWKVSCNYTHHLIKREPCRNTLTWGKDLLVRWSLSLLPKGACVSLCVHSWAWEFRLRSVFYLKS